MKLSSPEGKAVSFILLMIAVSLLARVLNRRNSAEVTIAPVAAGMVDAQGSDKPKKQARRKKERLPPLGPEEKIDPNTATVPELDRLPGVGPALATAIVKDREANGPFLSTGDLARVRGVSAQRARTLANHLDLPSALDHQQDRVIRDNAQPLLINRASTAELDRIQGVSLKLATRIIAVRDSLRGFRDWRQVDAIPGIGPALLERLQARTTLGR